MAYVDFIFVVFQICKEERKCNKAVKYVVLDKLLYLIIGLHLVHEGRWPFLFDF